MGAQGRSEEGIVREGEACSRKNSMCKGPETGGGKMGEGGQAPAERVGLGGKSTGAGGGLSAQSAQPGHAPSSNEQGLGQGSKTVMFPDVKELLSHSVVGDLDKAGPERGKPVRDFCPAQYQARAEVGGEGVDSVNVEEVN